MPEGNIGKFGTIKAEKLSVTQIDIPNTSNGNVGTLKLSDNLEIGGDGMILLDLEEFIASDNGETITYIDQSGDPTATATISVDADESGTNTLTSSASKTITEPEDITLNGKTFRITQSETTVTIDQTDTKKIISLEQGNLVLATYNTETGERTNKEIIFDSNNSIGEINGANYDLTVKSLDVTTTNTLNDTDLTHGQLRVDDTLILGGIVTSKSTNGNITIDPNGSGSLILGSDDNTKVDINALDIELDAGSNGVTINSAGAIDITTSASNSNITIDPNGSGTLVLGSADNTAVNINALAITATSVNSLTLTGGTASFALAGTGATSISGATTLDLDCSGQLQINSSAGTIDIGNDNINQNINIGAGGTRTITIGSSNATVKLAGTVHTSNITEIQDPLFIIGGTGTVNDDPTSDDNKDRGILFKYHNGTSAKKGFFGFDDSTSEFTFVPDATNTNEVISGTKGTISSGNIKSDSLTLTPSIINSGLSTDDNNPTDLDETKSILYFDLASASSFYGIISSSDDGRIITIFYDNSSSGSLRIDFGATRLRTGNGNNRYLTFTITGQSAQLIYISSVDKWCIINTGAAVS
jgi:hypothetical protein